MIFLYKIKNTNTSKKKEGIIGHIIVLAFAPGSPSLNPRRFELFCAAFKQRNPIICLIRASCQESLSAVVLRQNAIRLTSRNEVAVQESFCIETAGIGLGARDPDLPHSKGIAALIPTLPVIVVVFLLVVPAFSASFHSFQSFAPATIAEHTFNCIVFLQFSGATLLLRRCLDIVLLLLVSVGSWEGELTVATTTVVGEVVLLVAHLKLKLATIAGVVLAGHAKIKVGIFCQTPRPIGDEEIPNLVGVEEVARIDPCLLILLGLLDADAPGVVDVVVEGADGEVIGVPKGDGLAGGGVAVAEGNHLTHLGQVVLLVEGVERDAKEFVPATVVLPARRVAGNDVHVLSTDDLRSTVSEKMTMLIVRMVLGIDLVHPNYVVGRRHALELVDAAVHVNLAIGAEGLAAGIGVGLLQCRLDHFIGQFPPMKFKVLALEVGQVVLDLVVVKEEGASILLHPTAVRSQLPALVALSKTAFPVANSIGSDVSTLRWDGHSRCGQYR